MSFDSWQWGIAFLAAFMIGMSKTGIAGLGVLAVALFANIMPARQSAGVVLPMLIIADLVAVSSYWRDCVWRHLFRLFPWAVLGIIIGFLTVDLINDKQTARLIGGIIVFMVSMQVIRSWHKNRQVKPADETSPLRHHAFAGFMGIFAGFTTMVANAAGPIMNLYLLAMKMPKMQFMGTAAWYFFILNSFKVPFSWKLGLITESTIMFNLKLAPVALAGALLGKLVLRHMNQKLFETLALILAFISGLRLIW